MSVPFQFPVIYGRHTAQFKILPFDFAESRKDFKNCSDTDMAEIYGIVGAHPQYLLQMNYVLDVRRSSGLI